MERVGALISKLEEQFQQQADISKLILTAQMLLTELQQQKVGTSSINGYNKVTVVMPASHSTVKIENDENGKDREIKEVLEPIIKPKEVMPPTHTGIPEEHIAEKERPTENMETGQKKQQFSKWRFDVMNDVPTLAHQNKELYELNEVFGEADKEQSLNERLRVEKIELGSSLQGAPIKDLKKAIGINDRYLFINDLFRGDETMYERSIKTINSFNILPEAEYWIQRELKLKLGWKENDVVALFDQLVRRRFS
jgi:hypothetical protein